MPCKEKYEIIEKDSLKPIAEYHIVLGADNTKEVYFEEAWMNAVDDGLVDSTKETNYEMKFVEEIPAH